VANHLFQKSLINVTIGPRYTTYANRDFHTVCPNKLWSSIYIYILLKFNG